MVVHQKNVRLPDSDDRYQKRFPKEASDKKELKKNLPGNIIL